MCNDCFLNQEKVCSLFCRRYYSFTASCVKIRRVASLVKEVAPFSTCCVKRRCVASHVRAVEVAQLTQPYSC